MRKGNDLDSDLWLMDPDPGGSKTFGSGAPTLVLPRRLFFAAPQRIAITSSPKYYQKNQHFTRRKNQEEHGPDVMKVRRNHQKTISRWRKWAKPNLTQGPPPPPAKSDGEYFPRVFHVVIPDLPNSPAVQDGKIRGEGGVICGLI